MNAEDFYAMAAILVAFFLGAAVLVPVVALSARFALKPVMETWMKLRQGETTDQEKIMQDRRIALLEAELQNVQQQLQQRVEADEFAQKLSITKPES
jgi:hypothetical protein